MYVWISTPLFRRAKIKIGGIKKKSFPDVFLEIYPEKIACLLSYSKFKLRYGIQDMNFNFYKNTFQAGYSSIYFWNENVLFILFFERYSNQIW